MTILDNIKTASLQARKAKDQPKAALLSTLISDAQMVGKNDGNRETTEGEVIAIIKKYITNINETTKHLLESVNTAHLEQCVKDIEILTSFLPKQMSVAELEHAITKSIAELATINLVAPNAKDLGNVMKMLKERYGGQYDAKVAADLIKTKLKG